MWLQLTDYPPMQQGQKVLDALGGIASELVEWWTVEQLTAPDAAHKIFEKLNEAYDHLVNHDAQRFRVCSLWPSAKSRRVSSRLLEQSDRRVCEV